MRDRGHAGFGILVLRPNIDMAHIRTVAFAIEEDQKPALIAGIMPDLGRAFMAHKLGLAKITRNNRSIRAIQDFKRRFGRGDLMRRDREKGQNRGEHRAASATRQRHQQ